MGNSSNKLRSNDPSVPKDWRDKSKSDSMAEEEASKRPPLDVSSVHDLPPEYLNKITNSGVPLELCEKNLQVVLTILRFLYQRRFRLKVQEADDVTITEVEAPTERQEILEGPDIVAQSPTPATTSPITSPDEITPEDLAREARSISEGDPMPLFTKYVAHGQGGFGRVEKAKHIKSKLVMAIKRMPHTTVKERKANMQEVHFLRLLKGKGNVVNYYATFRKGEEIWVIMEFMEGGTLGQAAAKKILHESHIAYIAREVLKGLIAMHDMKLAHRDVKPHNVMIDIEGVVKLIDFGLCVDLNKNKAPTTMVGSSYWMAPEMISRQPHGTPSDIWSFGIVMYEVLLGKPFTGHVSAFKAMFDNAVMGGPSLDDVKAANLANISSKTDDAADSIFGGLGSSSKVAWTSSAYEFVKSCLNPDPQQRPTAKQLLAHPFLKSASDQREMRRILKIIFLSDSLQSGSS